MTKLNQVDQTGFRITVRQVTISAGAGFVVALTGEIMKMPGLPKVPAAEKIDVDENGVISGLFQRFILIYISVCKYIILFIHK